MELSEEEKKAIKDCDTIFMCLEDMMSEESADDYKSSYRLIKNLINNQQKEIEEKNIAVNKMSKDISRQLEEIDEKSTIIMAGAEKVKQLEKEIEELKEEQSKRSWVHIKENGEVEPLFYISKNKIRQKIKEVQETMCPNCCACGLCDAFKELLEEK